MKSTDNSPRSAPSEGSPTLSKSSNIVVAVRIRPFSQQEIALHRAALEEERKKLMQAHSESPSSAARQAPLTLSTRMSSVGNIKSSRLTDARPSSATTQEESRETTSTTTTTKPSARQESKKRKTSRNDSSAADAPASTSSSAGASKSAEASSAALTRTNSRRSIANDARKRSGSSNSTKNDNKNNNKNINSNKNDRNKNNTPASSPLPRNSTPSRRVSVSASSKQANSADGTNNRPTSNHSTRAAANAKESAASASAATAASQQQQEEESVSARINDSLPQPVVALGESGGSSSNKPHHTLHLLNHKDPSILRTVFTFDHIFSYFAPSEAVLRAMQQCAREAPSLAERSGTWHMMDLADSVRAADDETKPNHTPQRTDDSAAGASDEAAHTKQTLGSAAECVPPSCRAEAEQWHIFQTLGLPLVDAMFGGYNTCIFVYGETGSGKTYTMLGNSECAGLLPRTCREIFKRLREMKQSELSQQQKHGEESAGLSAAGVINSSNDNKSDNNSNNTESSFSPGAQPKEQLQQKEQQHQQQKQQKQKQQIEEPNKERPQQNKHQEKVEVKIITDLASIMSVTQSDSAQTQHSSPSHMHVVLSAMEIYNEQVYDLLAKPRSSRASATPAHRTPYPAADNASTGLKVRHHPVNGPFVEGLTQKTLTSYAACEELLRQSFLSRAQGSTAANVRSSRSHAIFQIELVRTTDSRALQPDRRTASLIGPLTSRMSLVDLAGSERGGGSSSSSSNNNSNINMNNNNNNNKSIGEKSKTETSNINVSLMTLRRVIEGLVSTKKNNHVVIPFRESVLTYLMSESFGGHSKTVMCTAISPSASHLHETESALRYATLARAVRNYVKIKTHGPVAATMIRGLQEHVRVLEAELMHVHVSPERLAELRLTAAGGAASLEARSCDSGSGVEGSFDSNHNNNDNNVWMQLPPQARELLTRWRQDATVQKERAERMMQVLLQISSSHPSLLPRGVMEELGRWSRSGESAKGDGVGKGLRRRLPYLAHVTARRESSSANEGAAHGGCRGAHAKANYATSEGEEEDSSRAASAKRGSVRRDTRESVSPSNISTPAAAVAAVKSNTKKSPRGSVGEMEESSRGSHPHSPAAVRSRHNSTKSAEVRQRGAGNALDNKKTGGRGVPERSGVSGNCRNSSGPVKASGRALHVRPGGRAMSDVKPRASPSPHMGAATAAHKMVGGNEEAEEEVGGKASKGGAVDDDSIHVQLPVLARRPFKMKEAVHEPVAAPKSRRNSVVKKATHRDSVLMKAQAPAVEGEKGAAADKETRPKSTASGEEEEEGGGGARTAAELASSDPPMQKATFPQLINRSRKPNASDKVTPLSLVRLIKEMKGVSNSP